MRYITLKACLLLGFACSGCAVHELSPEDLATRRAQLAATIDTLSARYNDPSHLEYVATNSVSLDNVPWDSIIEQGNRDPQHEWRLICLSRDPATNECIVFQIEAKQEDRRLVSIFELQWDPSLKSWHIRHTRQNIPWQRLDR